MTTESTIKMMQKEIQDLRSELEIVKQALIDEEKISDKELAAIRSIKAEMKSGKQKSFHQVFG